MSKAFFIKGFDTRRLKRMHLIKRIETTFTFEMDDKAGGLKRMHLIKRIETRLELARMWQGHVSNECTSLRGLKPAHPLGRSREYGRLKRMHLIKRIETNSLAYLTNQQQRLKRMHLIKRIETIGGYKYRPMLPKSQTNAPH
ncbi:hypothetical protein SAMN05444955_106158 [Lihuaxuella thermophila]|uniref:Uncharacterized protein n=1 Tax=Lihuaxuella thermophila TaxID=1173111 RepID=A0A1H8E8C7_9BACL|nr:hypothetical protein SAMN05444955_106158 [Lihuaxuella thermophila]